LYFVDFRSDIPQKVKIKVSLPDDITYEKDIYFSPNCKNNPTGCIRNPVQGMWYIRSYLGDKMRIMNDKIHTVFKSK